MQLKSVTGRPREFRPEKVCSYDKDMGQSGQDRAKLSGGMATSSLVILNHQS